MATVDNSLSGPAGVRPSALSLSATARAGTVGITAPERSAYSAGRTVHGLTTVEVTTGHHRTNSTPRLEAALPPATWHLRWYLYLPDLSAAGHGVDEARWVARLGSHGLVLHETGGGNVGLRLQPDGLAAAPITPELTGSAVPLGQWLRVEAASDGTDTAVAVYPAHATTGARVATWAGTGLPGGVTAEVSAYRYRRGVLLQPGMNDSTLDGTPIEDRQNQILVWDPDELPVYGADGDYGQETVDAVARFQQAYGLQPVDGEIGPETGAALDLAVAEIQGGPLPPPSHVSHLAVSDTAALGPAPAPSGTARGSGAAAGAAGAGVKAAAAPVAGDLAALVDVAGGRGGPASAVLGAAAGAAGTKAATGAAGSKLGLVGATSGTKAAAGTVFASLGLVGTATGRKAVAGTAAASIGVLGRADQLIRPVPAVAAIARPTGRLDGAARPARRLSGTAHRTGRYGGSATRR